MPYIKFGVILSILNDFECFFRDINAEALAFFTCKPLQYISTLCGSAIRDRSMNSPIGQDVSNDFDRYHGCPVFLNAFVI